MAWGMTPMRLAHLVGLADDVEAVDARRAGGGRHQRRQHANERGFAGAVRAEQAEHLAVADVEGQRVHGAKVAKPLGQMIDFNVQHANSYRFGSGSVT